MHKIIFIEGVSGVGKTTTSMLLYNELRDMGCKAYCYLEGDKNNPLDPFGGTYPPAVPIAEFTETYQQKWRNFVEGQFARESMLILDGTLFHHQINDLIREYSATDDVIVNHLSSLLHIIQPLNPIVFYLSSNDVGLRLRKARESRKQTTPTAEQIFFWENRKRVDLYAMEKLSVESRVLSIDDDWSAALDMMKYTLCR